MHSKSISSRIIGYVASLVITLTAFLCFYYPESFYIEKSTIIKIVLVLAVLQALVQLIFFLNILNEKGPRWNLIVFASTISIILIIIVFTIWIMHHLDYNMMPMKM